MRDVWNTSGSVLRQLAANLNVGADGLAAILNNASDAERARLLDSADAPLQAHKQLEERDRYFASAGHVERDEAGAGWQGCGHAGCTAQLLDQNGLPMKSPLRQWWCDIHASEAPAEDLEPWSPRYGYDPLSGALVDLERQAVEIAQAEREAQRLATRRELERAEREQLARDMPPSDDSAWVPSGPGWWS